MSWHSVQKAFNWPADHMPEAMTDPEIQDDIQEDTGVNIVDEALDPAKALSIQGLQRAVKLGTY